jgi:hypothetical protein
MHLQVRTNPKSSPPDVDLLLSRLAEKNVNLVAVGGSDVEFGGEFAFVPEDGQEKTAFEVLDTWKYRYRVLRVDEDPELTLCEVDNTPGSLHACLAQVARDNLENGRIIRDLLIGIPDEKERAAGKIPVHIYSEQVRASNSVGGR